MQAAAQGLGRRRGGHGQSFLFQSRLDERIHRMLRRRARRQGGLHRCGKGPMPCIRRTLLDPPAQLPRIGGRDRLLLLRRRHDLIVIVRQDARHERTLVRLPRHDRRFLRLATLQRRLALIEPQLRLARRTVRAVAVEAVLRENRADVP